MRPIYLLVGAALFGLAGNVIGASAAPAAEDMVFACAGCHGGTGSAVPNLAGMAPARFLELMHGFQSGGRPATVMNRIAPGYSDAELAVMAAYFRERSP